MFAILLLMVLPQATAAELQFVEAEPADPADVASIDSVVQAYYQSLSGEPGDRRPHKKRYASLFTKWAYVVTPTLATPEGRNVPTARRIDDWMTRYPDEREKPFYEWEVARRVETFGHMAQVYSTYEIRDRKSDEEPVSHGVTSFDLALIDGRWWIVGLQWSGLDAKEPLPPEYAPRK
jgi:hypothetical protein